MFKRIFLGLVVIGIWSLSAFAQDKEEILSLVYQRPYPEMEKTKALKGKIEYTPLLLEEAEFTAEEIPALSKFITKSKKQAVSMCYPKVMIKETEELKAKEKKELLFLDKLGNVEKRVVISDCASIRLSKNKKYLLVDVDSYKAGSDPYNPFDITITTAIFDVEGNKLWSFKDSPSGMWVSPTAEYVITHPGIEWGCEDELNIRYKTGEHKEISLSDIIHQGSTPYHLDISDNGEYFCVVSAGYLILFDKHGKVIWKKENGFGAEPPYFLKNDFIGAISWERSGNELITYFYLYDINGNLLWKNKIFVSVEGVYFVEEERKIYIISGWGHFFLFDIKTGNLLAKYTDDNAGTFFSNLKGVLARFAPHWRGIIPNSDFSRIITSASPEWESIERIEIFDKNLRKIGQKEYPVKRDKHGFVDGYIKRYIGNPTAKFSKDNLLSIMTKEGSDVYEIK